MGCRMTTDLIATFTLYRKYDYALHDGVVKSLNKHIVFQIWDASGLPQMSIRYFCDGVEMESWTHQGETHTPSKRHTIDHGRWLWNDFVSKGWSKVQSIKDTTVTS